MNYKYLLPYAVRHDVRENYIYHIHKVVPYEHKYCKIADRMVMRLVGSNPSVSLSWSA